VRPHHRKLRVAAPAEAGRTPDPVGIQGPDRVSAGESTSRHEPGDRARSGEPSRTRRGSRTRRALGAGSAASTSSARPVSGVERATAVVIGLLLAVTPLVVLPSGKESFRLVQGLVGGWLGLASIVVAAWSLRASNPGRGHARASDTIADGKVDVAALWRQPAIRALVPLTVVVAAGGLVTVHPVHFRAAFADFLIGAACVVGWSLALGEATLRRLLTWTIAPAVVVSLLAIDQYLGWFGVLDGLQIQAPTARLRLTSTIGNPGDLASFLVLPMLVAIGRLREPRTRARTMLLIASIVILATMALTATLAALGAVIVGGAVWWWLTATSSAVTTSSTVTSSAVTRRSLAAIALAIVVGAGAIAVSTPLRTRVMEKATQLTQGDLNALLTGRLDGWRAAWAMLQRAPIAGVGQGAFRAEFADTRLALTSHGVAFYAGQQQVMMATPHNEALSVAAEQGIPGLLALAWAIWCVCRRGAARTPSADRALASAGLATLAVLSIFSFPLHVPAVAWPWLLFLAWLLRTPEREPETVKL
jgi:O-antigen ligase